MPLSANIPSMQHQNPDQNIEEDTSDTSTLIEFESDQESKMVTSEGKSKSKQSSYSNNSTYPTMECDVAVVCGTRKSNARSVLVTGGCGFIGSHTTDRLLNQGYNVSVIDNMNGTLYDASKKHENLEHLRKVAEATGSFLRVYFIDVTEKAKVEKVFKDDGIELVVHLAARAGVRPSIECPVHYVDTNISGQVTMLELCYKYSIKNFVYASSSSVYGGNTIVPFSEAHPVVDPVSPYAATKVAGEMMARAYHNMFKIPVTGLRFFTVYGPRGRPDMAPYLFTDKIAQGNTIRQFGDGSSSRDYTYIDDIVDGVIGALDNPKPCEVYNLGNSQPSTLKEFINTIENIVGKEARIEIIGKQTGDVDVTYADITKAGRDFGYQPKHTLSEGLSKFFQWYTTYQNQKKLTAAAASSIITSDPAKLANVDKEQSTKSTRPRAHKPKKQILAPALTASQPSSRTTRC